MSDEKARFPPTAGWLKTFLDMRNRTEGPWWDLKWQVPDSIDETLVSFANDFNNLGGGYIIVGLDAKGIKEELKCQDKAKACHPSISGLVEGERLDLPNGKIVVAYWVPRSPFRPHSGINDKFYIRTGSMCRAGQPHEVGKLFAEPSPWESANYVQISKWKAQGKMTVTIIPDHHQEIATKCYDGSIGPLEPTHVALRVWQTGATISLALDDLLLTEDSSRNRPMIIVKNDRWNLFGQGWKRWDGK